MQGSPTVPRRFVASLLAIVSTGCYAYVPLEEGLRPAPGDEVRVYRTGGEEGGTESAEHGGRSEIQGLVVEDRPDSLLLSVRLQPARAGTFDPDRRQTLRIAYTRIERIERPRLDGLRTGAVVAGGIAALVGFMAIVLSSDSQGGVGDGGDGGPSLQVRIP